VKWFASSVAVIVIAVHQLRYIREPAANLQAIGREVTHEFTHPPAVTAFVSKARLPQVWMEEIGSRLCSALADASAALACTLSGGPAGIGRDSLHQSEYLRLPAQPLHVSESHRRREISNRLAARGLCVAGVFWWMTVRIARRAGMSSRYQKYRLVLCG
jgi:hypothetical protein